MVNEIISADDIMDVDPKIPKSAADLYVKIANARVRLAAPCVFEDEFPFAEDVTAILLPATLRWHENGFGSATSRTVQAGPYGQTTTTDTRSFGGMSLTNAEKRDLRDLCKTWKGDGQSRRRVFSFVPGKGVRR